MKNDLTAKLEKMMFDETWKVIWINGARTNYLVSSLGRVQNVNSGLLLHQCESGSKVLKYLSVTIYDASNELHRCFVHRLVATAFIPNPENKPQVNHIDGNKKNNAVYNLEWVTQSENIRHAIATGLMERPGAGINARNCKHTEDEVKKVCELLALGMSIEDVADILQVTRAFVSGIKYNGNWKDIRSQYNIPKSNTYGDRTKEQISMIDELLHAGIRDKRTILAAANLEDTETNRSYIKYRVRLMAKGSTTIEHSSDWRNTA